MKDHDEVNHPRHYTAHPSGVECIEVTEHMNFNLGNAVKYLWRAGLKSEDRMVDLRKAAWYLNREIGRLEKLAGKTEPEAPDEVETPLPVEEYETDDPEAAVFTHMLSEREKAHFLRSQNRSRKTRKRG